MDVKSYIQAARLRTLPLSVSGIIIGSFMAASKGLFNWKICILAILTTIGFQIISNFANDYGDGVKGTDNKDRIGPKRAVQSGKITPKQMRTAIVTSSIITFIIAIALIFIAFGKEDFINLIIFFSLGIASIAAAIKYTVGKKAYGYSGFGDLFVFLFFGLVSVIGSYYLYSKQLSITLLLPAFSVGFLSIGVLNLNNMRDRASDIKSGKNTLVVKMGNESAKYYHYYLLVTAFLFAILYTIVHYNSPYQFLFLITFFPIIMHFKVVANNKKPKLLDPELKKLAITTFLFSILFGIGLVI
ncbi:MULTISPECIES: 1,4-dihydroxy-2-naphthoate polyprenyltransferase [Flavobacteriaceae]|uniref:1,4-dihydroxy-2-naphthoate octaprenyltransferase n=2 Tax=Flavobacteriaceae TaxID=49546 RepID=A0A4Y8ANV4_9FLAO|nr:MULTISPECIES: 1,4-dihydroxy-2-naphthoate polyprenyltransferase [Flavobacteriaceae]TEW72109.1 1,4-dihydroxy-2-naphthoate polyprenyltransferase [Gramella jeungdoensis]GGK56464.1 1,4-dihydroxy-2-naphthoate octaprenyltransferase [Lutibacter litoralis]